MNSDSKEVDAMQRISAHEEVCAVRYAEILARIRRQ